MKTLFLTWVALFAIPTAISATMTNSNGTLSLFRWTTGYRAESKPIAEGEISENDFMYFLQTGNISKEISENLYPGCYLVHFARNTRTLASLEAKPRSEIHKVCLR